MRIKWFVKKKENIILVLILMLSGVLRFLFLGYIPGGTTPDEITYIYNAYSILITQRDVAGNFLPLSFNFFNSYSPVPVYLIAPFLAIFDLSLFAARSPFALAGCISVLLIYLITKNLFKNNRIALASSFVLAVSPWHINLSRTAYESSLALFFFLLGTYLFLKFAENKKIYLSVPAFLLGFYSYHATKVFLLLYVPLLIIFLLKKQEKRKNEIIIFLIGILLIFFSFAVILITQNVTRQNIFLWNNKELIANEVNVLRQDSKAPLFLKEMFSNKVSVTLKIATERYVDSLSPDYLFLKGEQGFASFIYSVGDRGMMYVIELPLLLIGIFCLFKYPRNIRNFLILGLLISPLPSALAIDQSYGARSIMMLLFLSILTGLGIYSLVEKAKQHAKIIYYIIVTLLIFGYLSFVSDYLYQYYFRYSVYGEKYWFSTSIDLVKYVASQRNKYNNIIIADSGGLLMYYGLFNKVQPSIIQKTYQSSPPRKLGNVSFIGDCLNENVRKFDPKLFLPKSTLYIVPYGCYEKTKIMPVKIITWRDEPQHVEWKVYEN